MTNGVYTTLRLKISMIFMAIGTRNFGMKISLKFDINFDIKICKI